MNVRHKICALLMLALWLPYYAHCIEPHCHSAGGTDHPCEHAREEDPGHDDDHRNEHESPWSECHQHDLAFPTAGALKLQPPPALDVIVSFIALALEPACSEPPPLPPDVGGSGSAPPLQILLVKTAQPVRGPSA